MFTHAKIAFRSKQDGIRGLYVMEDDGSNVQRLTAEWSDSWPACNLTNNPDSDDFFMDWISDDVLPVSPKGKITLTWGTLKQ